MKGFYGAVVIVAALVVAFFFWRAGAPGSLVFDGTEYQLVRSSHGAAVYTPGGAPSNASQTHLTLVRTESRGEIEAKATVQKNMKAQGATRVGDQQYWLRGEQSMTHSYIIYETTSVTMLSLTEKMARTESRLYSREIFFELERTARDVPPPARWFRTLF